MDRYIIVFNAGSSSLKFALFNADNLSLRFRGQIDSVFANPELIIKDQNNKQIFLQNNFDSGLDNALKILFIWIRSNLKNSGIIAAGHRVVHGGREFYKSVKITPEILNKLKDLIPLAPLHQPYNVEVIEAFSKLYPDLTQIACFDTAFHRTMSELEQIFALPDTYIKNDIIRYGFHGLSYQYITSVLAEYVQKKAKAKVIIAHLGNGASICAVKDLKSMATTMSFTALDGLVMGTRCGNIDPGVILHLMETKNMSVKQMSDLLYKESGLKGVSAISGDVRVLLKSKSSKAKLAIDLFCYKAAKELSALIPAIGGLDVLVFTAGIGENSPIIREKICNYLSYIGVKIDSKANSLNKTEISADNSKVEIYVIATNEEKIIAKQVFELL